MDRRWLGHLFALRMCSGSIKWRGGVHALFVCVRSAALQAREAAVAAREVAVGGMDCEVMAATMEGMPNGHSAGADAGAQVW